MFFRIPFRIEEQEGNEERGKKCNFTFIGSYKALIHIFIKIAYAISQITFPRIFRECEMKFNDDAIITIYRQNIYSRAWAYDGFIVNTRRTCSVLCVSLAICGRASSAAVVFLCGVIVRKFVRIFKEYSKGCRNFAWYFSISFIFLPNLPEFQPISAKIL